MTEPVLRNGPAADRSGYLAAKMMEKYAAPAEVLGARPEDLLVPPALACQYADDRRTYPIHTPAAAWASAAAYHDAGGGDAAVGDRIKEACAAHRLWGAWDRLAAAAGAFQKQAAAAAATPPRWALPDRRRYPLDTPAQVKAAADYFLHYADRLAPADRRAFAGAVVKAAGDLLAADVRNRLEAEAGLARPAADPGRPFRARAELARDPGLRAALAKAAAGAGADPLADAELLRRVDRVVGGPGGDPVLETTGETPAAARAKLAAVVRAPSGNWYAAADLDRVPDGLVRDLFRGAVVVSRRYKEELLEKQASFEQVLVDHGGRPVDRARRARVDWPALAAAGS